jgi:hypothetical protein
MCIVSICFPPLLGYSLLTISTVQWAADDQTDAPVVMCLVLPTNPSTIITNAAQIIWIVLPDFFQATFDETSNLVL